MRCFRSLSVSVPLSSLSIHRDSCIVYAVRPAADAHPTLVHDVRTGDTLWDVSVRYGVSMRSIRSVNGLPNDFVNIQPGEVLALPVGAAEPVSAGASAVEVNSTQTQVSSLLSFGTAVLLAIEGCQSLTYRPCQPEHPVRFDQNNPCMQAEVVDDDAVSASKLWLQEGSCIKHTTPDQIEGILLAQGTVNADKDTVVVTYTPGCNHCHSIESLVRHLQRTTVWLLWFPVPSLSLIRSDTTGKGRNWNSL